MCSTRTLIGIGARCVASGCCGETTLIALTVSTRSRLNCGGTGDKDPMRPMAQRRSSTGSATASHMSTYSLSGIAGNFTWKAATAEANTATGNMASTTRLSSVSSPLARPFARALPVVNLTRHCARAREKRVALIGQRRTTTAALEELYADLPFQIGQRLAHHGLGASQAPASRREVAFLRHRNKGA